MSDYTPTTEEVRDAYAGHDFDYAIAGAQFDRWLAEVERAAAEKAWTDGWNEGVDFEVYVRDINQAGPNPYRLNEGEKQC